MSILDDAKNIAYGDRHESYGEPAVDFARTAKMWSAILGMEVTAEQVPLCMICVKLSRLCHSYSRDSAVDVAGYADTFVRTVEANRAAPASPAEQPPGP